MAARKPAQRLVCVPDRPLPWPRHVDATTCTQCGCRLRRAWWANDIDWTWVDERGGTRGGESPIPGVTNYWQWLNWLLAEYERTGDIRAFGMYSVASSAGWWPLPWEHRHEPAPTGEPPFGDALPWCCGEPMHLVRHGWRCRESKTLFTTAQRPELFRRAA